MKNKFIVLGLVVFFSFQIAFSQSTVEHPPLLYGVLFEDTLCAINADNGVVFWKKTFPKKYISYPVLAEKNIILSTTSHQFKGFRLVCMNNVTGETIWEKELLEYLTPIEIVNDVLIVKYEKNKIGGINIENGEVLWQNEITKEVSKPYVQTDLMILHLKIGNSLFLTYNRKWIYQIDAKSGSIVSIIKTKMVAPFVNRIEGTKVYFGSYNNYIYQIDFSNSKVLYKTKVKQKEDEYLRIGGINNKTLYTIDEELLSYSKRYFYAMDLPSKKLLWKNIAIVDFVIRNRMYWNTRFFVEGDDMTFCYNERNYLCAISSSTGKQVWVQKGNTPLSMQSIGNYYNGNIFTGVIVSPNYNGAYELAFYDEKVQETTKVKSVFLRAIDAKTGKINWEMKTKYTPYTLPILTSDNKVIVPLN